MDEKQNSHQAGPAENLGTRYMEETGTSFERVRNISRDIARLDFDPTLT